jgi:hypothetical protein
MLKIGVWDGLQIMCPKCGANIVIGNEKKVGIGIIPVRIGITNIERIGF